MIRQACTNRNGQSASSKYVRYHCCHLEVHSQSEPLRNMFTFITSKSTKTPYRPSVWVYSHRHCCVLVHWRSPMPYNCRWAFALQTACDQRVRGVANILTLYMPCTSSACVMITVLRLSEDEMRVSIYWVWWISSPPPLTTRSRMWSLPFVSICVLWSPKRIYFWSACTSRDWTYNSPPPPLWSPDSPLPPPPIHSIWGVTFIGDSLPSIRGPLDL